MSIDTKPLCEDLLHVLRTRLAAPEFMLRHRQTAKDFTRKRVLPFVVVVVFLLNLLKRATQDELDEFFNLEQRLAVAPRVVTKSAFTQARRKLRAEAFIELNRVQIEYFYRHFPVHRWHGLRLVAIDGSTAELSVSPDIVKYFGLWGHTPLARLSVLFDVLNGLLLDAWIGPKSSGERVCAAQHLQLLGPGDLVLLDRGYPAVWLFALMVQLGADFCARMPLGVWTVVDQFVATGLSEQIVTLPPEPPPAGAPETSLRRPLRVRLVRVVLDTGDIEVLATTLLDPVRYPAAEFKDLYHYRWPVEEDYKVVKLRAEVENWTGKTALSVRQDFYAKIFTTNLTLILTQPAQATVTQQTQGQAHVYHINFAHALSKMKDLVVLLLQRETVTDLLSALWNVLVRTIEPVRPGRKYPRPKGPRRKRFSMCYKSGR